MIGKRVSGSKEIELYAAVQQLLPQSMTQRSKGRGGYVMLQCSNQDWGRADLPDGFISVLHRSIMLQCSMDILNSCAVLNG